MEDEVERLRLMLGAADVWEQPKPESESRVPFEPFMITQPDPFANAEPYTDSSDDEKILCAKNRIEGPLQQAVGPTEALTAVPNLPLCGLGTGQIAPLSEKFCSLLAVASFPYQYVSLATRSQIADTFFAHGNLYKRVWDFFYLWPPETLAQKPVILIPSTQVERFLVIINNELGTRLRMPDNATTIGFVMDFPDDSTPRPRYLGRTHEREMAEHLKKSVPRPSYRPKGETAPNIFPSDRSLEAFKKRMQLLLESNKRKNSASKEKKKSERIAKQKSWDQTVKRVQRYLGIREKSPSPETRNPWETSSTFPTNLAPKALDLDKPAPFSKDDLVIFICIDVESYERNHKLITEIGIATLDTADVTLVAPGEGGTQWFKAIRARHFRIKDHGHFHNKDFVHGCADRFQFGESEWISLKDAPHEVSKCFKEPYSTLASNDPPLVDSKDFDDPRATQCPEPKRNIILVGHDVTTDITYLRNLGYDPSNLANLQGLVDTVSMYRSFRREENPRNLGSILADLDIAGWYLHNAGNDAVYTLQAMISIAVKAIFEKQDREACEQDTKAPIE